MKPKLILLIVLPIFVFCSSPPRGQSGEKAKALVTKIYQSTNIDAWEEKTKAVSFVWDGSAKHTYFWDKQRNLVEVKWDDIHVQFFKKGLNGIVYQKDKQLQDEAKVKKIVYQAYKYFINDSYWLNPVFHLKSPGAKVQFIDNHQLLLYFSKGGVTPGDSYLFTLDKNFLVTNMKMWVSIIPIKGISVDFENYTETETGVKLALDHKTLFLNIKIRNVKMYKEYPSKKERDRFSNLLSI